MYMHWDQERQNGRKYFQLNPCHNTSYKVCVTGTCYGNQLQSCIIRDELMILKKSNVSEAANEHTHTI